METTGLSGGSVTLGQGGPLRLTADRGAARLTSFGVDTEGTGRQSINLLKSPVELRLSRGGSPIAAELVRSEADGCSVRYELAPPGGGLLRWTIVLRDAALSMSFSRDARATERAEAALVFPFDPHTAVTCVISSVWEEDGRFRLPAILSAPDLGQLLVSCDGETPIRGRIEGSRRESWVTMTLEIPAEPSLELRFTPVILPPPQGYHDAARWALARRGWFNLIQLGCGASGGGSAVSGVWANNVLSDPVSSVLYMLADATLLVPELAPGVSMAPILRRAVEYWIDRKTDAEGLVAYTAGGKNQHVMDGNPAVLIGARAYVDVTGDTPWLERRIADIERLSRYLERRDVDGDGLVESTQSGNSGSRPPRDPDCAWDCYVSGHKNAYVNTLVYGAWRGLAALESRLERHSEAERYSALAERLRGAFLGTLWNPRTGWLGFWRSRDGQLHDLHMDAPSSFAVEYGLIEADRGREMLGRYWSALRESGFSRFDLGVPLTLKPVPREEMEHYSEFQQFLNGGCGVSNTSYLLNALSTVGMTTEADMILDAMLERQSRGVFPNGGGFQNGFVDRMGAGAEVFDWSGNPAGYEGHLVYCWAFLHSMLMREPTLRSRCRPWCPPASDAVQRDPMR